MNIEIDETKLREWIIEALQRDMQLLYDNPALKREIRIAVESYLIKIGVRDLFKLVGVEADGKKL